MAERIPLASNGKAAEPLPSEPPATLEPQPQQQTITIEEINGRLAELSDLNQMLTGRLAQMRGQMMLKEKQITDLTNEVMALREAAKPSVLKDKRKQ